MCSSDLPWYVALFGRDTLIAAHQARAFLPGHLLDSLAGLAARQGAADRAANDEAPGKILHEVRLTPRAWLGDATRGRRAYYGSVDGGVEVTTTNVTHLQVSPPGLTRVVIDGTTVMPAKVGAAVRLQRTEAGWRELSADDGLRKRPGLTEIGRAHV
mgnify:CR=1 FL=1